MILGDLVLKQPVLLGLSQIIDYIKCAAISNEWDFYLEYEFCCFHLIIHYIVMNSQNILACLVRYLYFLEVKNTKIKSNFAQSNINYLMHFAVKCSVVKVFAENKKISSNQGG